MMKFKKVNKDKKNLIIIDMIIETILKGVNLIVMKAETTTTAIIKDLKDDYSIFLNYEMI